MTIWGVSAVVVAFVIGTMAIVFVFSLVSDWSLRPWAIRDAVFLAYRALIAWGFCLVVMIAILLVIYLVEYA